MGGSSLNFMILKSIIVVWIVTSLSQVKQLCIINSGSVESSTESNSVPNVVQTDVQLLRETRKKDVHAAETAEGAMWAQIDIAVSEVQSDTNQDVNGGSVTDSKDHDIILSRPSSDHIDSDAATRDSSDGHGHAGESSTTPSVQTLILHVGPQKTGSTSVQMNAIRSWKTRKVFRQSDHFQEIGQDFSYTKFRLLREECLEERKNKAKARHQGSNKNVETVPSNTHDNIRYDDSCTHIHDIKAIYKEAYNKLNTTDIDTDTPFPIYNTLHSNEEWSLLPHSPTNCSFALLRDLILPWDDIHIVIFYRPFQDWITSKYLQYRKHMVVNARRIGKGFWKERYLIGRNEQMLFPNFFRRIIHPHNDYDDLRDTLGTYEYFQHFASYLEQQHQQQSQQGNAGGHYPKVHIQIMQMNPPDGSSIEHEFLCNLPGATNSCQNMKKNQITFSKRNNAQHVPFSLDLIIVEAYFQGILSIGRHEAHTKLDEKMKKLNMTLLDLPHACVSDEEVDWIWNRTLVSEQMFGPGSGSGASLNASNETIVDQSAVVKELRRSWSEKIHAKKFCSVDATAALKIDWFRAVFDDCTFQSPNKLNVMLGDTGKQNPIWENLGCSTSSRNNLTSLEVNEKINTS